MHVRSALVVSGFWAIQLSALLVFVVPSAWSLVALWAIAHFSRALGLTIVFHRHLAHGAFEMNRWARFAWAFLGTAAMQKGPLWWAGHHLAHHRFADREGDPHSPRHGLFQAHLGWFLSEENRTLPSDNPVVRRFSVYPEMTWLDRNFLVPPLVWALACFAIGGLPWLVWGFCLPTVTLAHSTYAINTVNHLWGSRRFDTGDDSTNNPVTALLAVGEGWHNNHHRYPRAARNGFYWWELDPSWYCIRAMQAVGLVSNVKAVPDRIYREARTGVRERPASAKASRAA